VKSWESGAVEVEVTKTAVREGLGIVAEEIVDLANRTSTTYAIATLLTD
jgi:hypothetical protein